MLPRATGAVECAPRVISMLRTTITIAVALTVAAAVSSVRQPLRAQTPSGAAQRAGAQAASSGRTPTIEERTSGLQKLDGFFPLYWEERSGTLWLEIPRFGTEVLYATGLSAGLGSNDIGLDRGQEGGGKIVTFERVGPKVMMIQPNTSFRSTSRNPA